MTADIVRLLAVVIVGLLMVPSIPTAEAEEYLVYVGTYTRNASKGIYGYRFDPSTGKATSIGLAAETVNPSFLAVHPKQRFLYAANEISNGEGESGILEPIDYVSTKGSTPRHFAIDPTGNYLFVANQDSDEVVLFRINPQKGTIIPTGTTLKIPMPVCVVFVPLP